MKINIDCLENNNNVAHSTHDFEIPDRLLLLIGEFFYDSRLVVIDLKSKLLFLNRTSLYSDEYVLNIIILYFQYFPTNNHSNILFLLVVSLAYTIQLKQVYKIAKAILAFNLRSVNNLNRRCLLTTSK